MKKNAAKSYLFIFLSTVLGLICLGTGSLVLHGLCDKVGHADVALVLGSKVELDGTPSLRLRARLDRTRFQPCQRSPLRRLRARLDRTLELYRAGYYPYVIVSGGFGKEGYDEATVMQNYLVACGIPSKQIILDCHGDTTFASARNAVEIARQRKFNSVFVISQYFHIPRARLALERFGISTVYSAHARFFEFRDVYSSIREVAGYVSYFFRHYD